MSSHALILSTALLVASLAACDQTSGTAAAATPAGSPGNVASAPVEQALIAREPALNAAPFGLEIGYANLAGVKQKIGAITKLKDEGINKFSHGPMLSSDGVGLGIDDATGVGFVFDAANVLVGIVITMPKNPKELQGSLSGKYRTVSNKIDGFMNNGTARFEKGDSWIEIDAPHLSFEMNLSYLTKGFMAQINTQSENEGQQRQQTKNRNL